MTSSGRGREEIEELLGAGRLERVSPSRDLAERLLTDAAAHIVLAGKGTKDDPAGALQLSYDAARKAAVALLAVEGLRATTRGGHAAVFDAVRAQLEGQPSMAVFGRLNRLRRRRNTTEYPSRESPGVTSAEAERALVLAREALEAARGLLHGGS